MTANKRYYRDVKKLFPVYLKKEKLYLNQLKEQIDEYEDTSYEELVDIFGNPIDIVKAFVNEISKFDCDFDLVSGRYVIDAKSIMGIFSLDLSKPIDLNIHADGAALDSVMEIIDKYTVE